MMPIVFCASFVPCVKATKPPEIELQPAEDAVDQRRAPGGARSRAAHTMSAAAPTMPRSGATSEGMSDVLDEPVPLDHVEPAAAIAEPTMPPMSAWLELEGRPRYQVIRFQVIAPTSPASTTSSVTASASTIPVATVAATLKETKAPATFRIAAVRTASRGESARVETLVAIELAVSWKPFVKSKKSATTTTATRVSSTESGARRS